MEGQLGSRFHDWVGYRNAPEDSVSPARERAMNGDRDPFGVCSTLAAMRIKCDVLAVPGHNGPATMRALSGPASTKGKTLTVTVTNPSLDLSELTRIRLTSESVVEGRGRMLTYPKPRGGFAAAAVGDGTGLAE
jgi:hypothetical protein